MCSINGNDFYHFLIYLLGKSNLLEAIGNRELPIPDHIDIFHLKREMPPSDKTALQCVMEVDSERLLLEKEAERLAVLESDGQYSVSHDFDDYYCLTLMYLFLSFSCTSFTLLA